LQARGPRTDSQRVAYAATQLRPFLSWGRKRSLADGLAV
jgi:hypothetical protein